MADFFRFLKETFSNPKFTGAVAPSSDELARVMTGAARVGESMSIAELGPGTGVFSRQIMAEMPAGASFFAIEINAEFVSFLKERMPDLVVYQDSASNLAAHLEKRGQGPCDCIVSGLPFAVFSDEIQDAILRAAFDSLKTGGRFVTFTYVHSPYLTAGRKFRTRLESMFGDVTTTRVVWNNLPPAFAYCATRH